MPEMEQGRGTPPWSSRAISEADGVTKRFSGAPVDGALHPIFGKMKEKPWMRWGYLHSDHHLRQFGCLRGVEFDLGE
jgi:hypothetical protein